MTMTNVKIIRNEDEYKAAMERLSALMPLELSPEEEDELELLALVIQDFERKIVKKLNELALDEMVSINQKLGLYDE